MNLLELPWLDAAIVLATVGWVTVAQIRQAERAYRWGLAFAAASFSCTLLAWLAFNFPPDATAQARFSLQQRLLGQQVFRLDSLNAPLLPMVALLHFLVALATARKSMRRFSISWSMASEAIRLATFSCQVPWLLIALLGLATVPPWIELINRQQNVRVYVWHMALYLVLLVAGWIAIDTAAGVNSPAAQWGTVVLMAAILVRCGTFPAHCWVIDWFEQASLGNALLYVAPLSGVYAAVRLVLPIASERVLQFIGLMSLGTAVYAAALATVQRDARRLYAYVFLSYASMVLVGLELQSLMSLTASLCLWFSAILSLGGFGLALRAMEARFGRISLTRYHGLYGHSPTLAICFLLTGLASVGFPATIGFIASELLIESAVEASPWVGIAVVTASALNGIAIVRAYLLIFTGARHTSTVDLEIGPRERIAMLTLSALVIGGGIFPQPGVSSRHAAVEQLLEQRQQGPVIPGHRRTFPSEAKSNVLPAARSPAG